MKIIISIIVVLQYHALIIKGAFICNDISDSLMKLDSHENLQERIKAMDEQILQLQRLAAIGFENVTSLHKDTLPSGNKCLSSYLPLFCFVLRQNNVFFQVSALKKNRYR